MKILLIEDDQKIGSTLKRCLEDDCYVVDWATSGCKGSFWARTNKYDLIILDYVLPEKDGKIICKEIRSDEIHTPIIMLTIRFEVEEKVNLFNLGVDDYITKPDSYQELKARIRAILRREPEIKESVINVSDVCINVSSGDVLHCGKNIYFTRKEFLVIKYLAERKNQIVSRAELMEGAWDINVDTFSNSIEMHVSNIRRKFRECGQAEILVTVSGRGYRLVE